MNLLALTNAYRALSQSRRLESYPGGGGDWPNESRRVIGAAASFIVTDILADRGARALTFGRQSAGHARLGAVKTGTSKDMRDNWCIGFIALYGRRLGGQFLRRADARRFWASRSAAPIWRDLVHRLHDSEASVAPLPPAGVIRSTVAFEPPVESERSEWFQRGTEMAVVRANFAGTKSVPRFTHDLLAAHTEGLVALSGCREGEVARRLRVGDRAGARAVADAACCPTSRGAPHGRRVRAGMRSPSKTLRARAVARRFRGARRWRGHDGGRAPPRSD